uniref:Oxysterol-binding protein n=1 Tax=Wuchereria bancrofti TaxID=6293 RepID=A0A1I8EX75_WUCBA
MSLWSLLKNALGKELYKIPLPVNFNEPLSFIQRLTECLEYSYLIDKAAKIKNPADQMIYVGTFVISTLCNTPFRTCKPFNPLWCETFEFDRMADLGWRAIAEQVSHHPPISAIHAEGNGWILDEDIDVHSQFQATIMKIFPEGTASIFFPETKSFYYWTMKDIKTLVKGFIIGPITVHNEGNCVIMVTKYANL